MAAPISISAALFCEESKIARTSSSVRARCCLVHDLRIQYIRAKRIFPHSICTSKENTATLHRNSLALVFGSSFSRPSQPQPLATVSLLRAASHTRLSSGNGKNHTISVSRRTIPCAMATCMGMPANVKTCAQRTQKFTHTGFI
jgi:hypothetical protein